MNDLEKVNTLLKVVIIKIKAFDLIKEHKLLNYVLKNNKCAAMYHLNDEELNFLKEAMK